MRDKVFVDSNIIIYAKIKSQDAEKHIGAQSHPNSIHQQIYSRTVLGNAEQLPLRLL